MGGHRRLHYTECSSGLEDVVSSVVAVKYQREKKSLVGNVFEYDLPESGNILLKLYLEFTETDSGFKRVGKTRVTLRLSRDTQFERVEIKGLFSSCISLFVSAERSLVGDVTMIEKIWMDGYMKQLQSHMKVSCYKNNRSVGENSIITEESGDTNIPDMSITVSNCSFVESADGPRPYSFGQYIETRSKIETTHKHVIFCIPGLGGNSWDFSTLINIAKLESPASNVEWHACKSNNGKSFESIASSAERIHAEIMEILGKSERTVSHISLVCHSLGALIGRYMLETCPFESHLVFHSFISFATPHLGVGYMRNTPLESLLHSWKMLGTSQAIKEILGKDGLNQRDCLLYRLSQGKVLSKFQVVRIYGSPQDLYVPFHSAMAEIEKSALYDEHYGNIYLSMLVNINSVLINTRVERVSVTFKNIEEANAFDAYLGREAHLRFLTDTLFLRQFLQFLT